MIYWVLDRESGNILVERYFITNLARGGRFWGFGTRNLNFTSRSTFWSIYCIDKPSIFSPEAQDRLKSRFSNGPALSSTKGHLCSKSPNLGGSQSAVFQTHHWQNWGRTGVVLCRFRIVVAISVARNQLLMVDVVERRRIH